MPPLPHRSGSCWAGTRCSDTTRRATSVRPSRSDDPPWPSSKRGTYPPLRSPERGFRTAQRPTPGPSDYSRDVLVACSFCGLCLVLEAPKECLGDVLLEVHAWILCDHARPEIFGKRLVSDTEDIQTYSVVQELHLQRLVGCDPGCCVESNGVPGRLDPSGGHTTMFEELTNSIRTVDFKTIRRAAERLEQAEVVECGTDEDKLRIELLACLSTKLVRPEEDAMRMVEEQRRAEFPKQAGGFAGRHLRESPCMRAATSCRPPRRSTSTPPHGRTPPGR